MAADPIPISSLTAISDVATGDLVVVVDVSDTSQSSNGTTKRATIAQVTAALGGGGTVTSVGLAMPNIFAVTNSPVSSSGNLTASLVNQPVAQVLAGPATGSPAAPTFRALVATDIPNIAETQVTGLTTDLASLSSGLAGKAADNTVVHLTGNETIAGTKTFSAAIAGSVTGTAANVTGTVAIANGGTGQVSASASFNALSPLTTLGDVLYASGASTNARLAGNTSTTKMFLSQTGSGSASAAPVWQSIATGQAFNSYTSTINVLTFSSTLTVDCQAFLKHQVTLTGNTTISFANLSAGMTLTLIAIQDGTGNRSITWPAGIKWSNSTAPSATGANKVDVFTIWCIGAGSYLGFQAGQNMG